MWVQVARWNAEGGDLHTKNHFWVSTSGPLSASAREKLQKVTGSVSSQIELALWREVQYTHQSNATKGYRRCQHETGRTHREGPVPLQVFSRTVELLDSGDLARQGYAGARTGHEPYGEGRSSS